MKQDRNNRKVSIAHILPGLGLGGGEKLAIDICSFLDRKSFNVEIISLFPPKDTIYEQIARDRGLKVIYLNKKLGLDIKIISQLAAVLKQDKIDIVHTHLYVMPYVLIASILAGVRIRIHTVHSIASKELSGFRKGVMYIAYKFFKTTPVAISAYVGRTIQEEYRLKNNKVVCIYNGIDTKRFKKIEEKTKDKIRVINVGRFTGLKNQKLLIDAFYIGLQESADMLLILVGDGEMRRELEKKVKDLGIDQKIIFRGTQKDINKELNNADIYVLSSDYEGLPLSVLEAMSCGLPIVTTKAGGVVDIVENNKNGLIVEVGDQVALAKSIIKLVKDEKLRKEMGLNSIRIAQQYDIRIMTKEYEDLYLMRYNET